MPKSSPVLDTRAPLNKLLLTSVPRNNISCSIITKAAFITQFGPVTRKIPPELKANTWEETHALPRIFRHVYKVRFAYVMLKCKLYAVACAPRRKSIIKILNELQQKGKVFNKRCSERFVLMNWALFRLWWRWNTGRLVGNLNRNKIGFLAGIVKNNWKEISPLHWTVFQKRNVSLSVVFHMFIILRTWFFMHNVRLLSK